MAKGSFDPEIKQAMAESPADRARDKAQGIKEGSPQDQRLDALPANRPPTTLRQGMANARAPAPPPMHTGVLPPDLHHVSAAAGIAHAILGNRGLR